MLTVKWILGLLLFWAIWWEVPMHLREIASELKRMNDRNEGK